jgi:DNA-binding SARP family transcriptional activator
MTNAPEPKIAVNVLGHIQVLVNNEPVHVAPTLLSVVGLLAVGRGRPVATSTLLDRLWENTPVPRTAAKTLLGHIARLRRILGDGAIVRVEHGYRMDLSLVEVDLVTLDGRARAVEVAFAAQDSATVVRLASAIRSMWHGAPFQGTSIEFPLEDSAQLFEIRARVEELRVISMIEQRRSSEIVGDLETLVAEDPSRELWWVYLMAALQENGRSVDALRAFSRLRRFLAESDGLEPGSETRLAEGCVLRNENVFADGGNQCSRMISAKGSERSPMVASLLLR